MNNQMNRIYAPIVLALSILIGIFALRPAYTEYMDVKTQETKAKDTRIERQKTLDALTILQTSFQSQSGSTELTARVKKLDKRWNEASVLSVVMLNDYTKSTEVIDAPIGIRSISLDKGTKLPSGLSLGSVTMTLQGKTIDDIVEFLTHLTTSSEYAFTLDAINLPLSTPVPKDEGNTVLAVSLGVYYYE